MRINVCVRKDATLVRIICLNESKTGVYVVPFTTKLRGHFSHHQDGKSWFKEEPSKLARAQHRWDPIESINDIRMVLCQYEPIDQYTQTHGDPFNGDDRATENIVIDRGGLSASSALRIDSFIVSRQSEQQLIDHVHSFEKNVPNHRLLELKLYNSSNFPHHKIALAIYAADVIAQS